MQFKLPKSIYNYVSAIGAVLVLGSILELIFQLLIALFTNQNGYFLGIFMFVFVPLNLMLGIILIFAGIYISKRISKSKNTGENLEQGPNEHYASQNKAVIVFIIGMVIFFVVVMIGNIKTMDFANSDAFCGEICHSAMEPEFISYKNSKHDNVTCIHCHYSDNDNLFIKSKLAALRQIGTIVGGDYKHPLTIPPHTLEPGRNTCEHCHKPAMFNPRILRNKENFLSDKENTKWITRLILRVGNEHSSKVSTKGIHWHMHRDNIVQFVSLDDKKQDLPWVRYININENDTTIYIDSTSDFQPSSLDTVEIFTMDCMDCHNRISHNFASPSEFIDREISQGNISETLYEIKRLLIDICEEEFPNVDSLKTYSIIYLKNFYTKNYPGYYLKNEKIIKSAITVFTNEYAKNIFPEMKVKWDSFPSNAGHKYNPGCFRCHNDLHKSEEGIILKRDCNQCHTITSQGNPNYLENAIHGEELEFSHPVDIDESWRETNCNECHTGLTPNVYGDNDD